MDGMVFTIGHSTHPIGRFVGLLQQHGITALCDVRSQPYSRLNPQYNRENLKASLPANGIVYVYLGRELGARSADPSCYRNGRVQYELVARTELFQSGLTRVREGMQTYRVALMCAEKEPLECHRTLLVSRHLAARGVGIQHIHADGSLESHADLMSRMAQRFGLDADDLFRSGEERLAEAYRLQEARMV